MTVEFSDREAAQLHNDIVTVQEAVEAALSGFTNDNDLLRAIGAANRLDVAMIFTGVRHFRH